MNKSIILMSGGLDSLVALGYSKLHTDYNVQLGLTFDYGQKAAKKEIEASKNICSYYNVEHKVINLNWLKEITNTALVNEDNVPKDNFCTKKSAKQVWVPNRNALFLNIAACYCDSFKYNYIIYGANKDEASTFSDNTEKFMNDISELFMTSTQEHPKVIAPLINCNKDDIVRIAVEDNVPLELVMSCYNSTVGHCGECESCYHLKKALEANNCERYLSLLFEKK